MPSSRAEIGPDDIKNAKAAAASRQYSSADPLIIADTVERGLSLRVQNGSSSWILKFNGSTKSLGSLAEIRTSTTAREVAAKVRALLRAGDDVNGYLKSRRAGGGHQAATEKTHSDAARAAGRWTWEDLAKHYCDDHLSNPRHSVRGKREHSLLSAANSRRYLLMNECRPLFGKLLSELRPGNLERIRDACEKDGRKTASRQFVAAASAALTYAREYHSERAGLEGVSRWWLDVRKLESTIPTPRTRHPSLKELAQVLHIFEMNQTAPNRQYARKTTETVRAALWFLVLTGQRTTPGMSLQKACVFPWKDGPQGWQVAFFPAGEMKGRVAHALPIPARVALLFEKAAAPDESAFIFSATRGLAKKDRPLSRWTVATAIDRLRGRSSDPKAGAEFDGPDLLEGIATFSPHDLRRTFATTCSDLSVRGDAISAVLAHAEPWATGQAPIRTAEMTRIAYDFSQQLDLKRQAIEAWTNAVFAACDMEWTKHRPRRGLSRVVQRHEPWYDTMEREKAMAKPKMDLAKLRAIEDIEIDYDPHLEFRRKAIIKPG